MSTGVTVSVDERATYMMKTGFDLGGLVRLRDVAVIWSVFIRP